MCTGAVYCNVPGLLGKQREEERGTERAMKLKREEFIWWIKRNQSNTLSDAKRGLYSEEKRGERKKLQSLGEKKKSPVPMPPLGSSSVVIHLAAFSSMFNDGRSNQ